MRIKLELHPDDLMAFSTITHPMLFTGGNTSYRALVIKVNGKAFTVWRTLDIVSYGFMLDQKRFIEEVDKALIATMEEMLTKVFNDACAAVPEGKELLPEKQ